MCTHLKKPEGNVRCLPRCLSTLFFGCGSLTEHAAQQLARLAVEQAWGSTCLAPSPSTEVADMSHCAWHFVWLLIICPHVLMLRGQALHQLSPCCLLEARSLSVKDCQNTGSKSHNTSGQFYYEFLGVIAETKEHKQPIQ